MDADTRASDAERTRTAEILRDAAAAGRLEVDELEERVELAGRARTRGELERLVSDLPADASRPGGSPPAAPERALAILGDADVDLRHLAPGAEADVVVTAVLGDVRVRVPPGTRVELRGFAVLGDRKVEVDPAPEGPTVRVHATAWLGDVRVSSAAPRRRWHGLLHPEPPPAPEPPPLPGSTGR